MLAVGGAAAIEEAVAVMCGVKLIPIMDSLWFFVATSCVDCGRG